MLFSKFGDLVRIDMKRNYAFVQYTTTEDATKAKDATNGGQLDQNVITVECE
jgi:arginine/serine-rich splicing factor 4/5/6